MFSLGNKYLSLKYPQYPLLSGVLTCFHHGILANLCTFMAAKYPGSPQ